MKDVTLNSSERVLDRRDFIKATGFVGGAIAFPHASKAFAQGISKKSNVILILTDDQGYGDLGCLGNPWLKTPNIDRLYADSVRLTDFHVSPVCSPTRAALMTGRHCRHVGVRHTNNYQNLLSCQVPTIADIFALNDYRTGIFGKWHLGDHYPYRACDRGFQESIVHGNGAIAITTGDVWGNDYFDDTYLHNGKKEKYAGYCTDVWFDQAMHFMANSKDPFFCYIPTNAPHGPYIVADKYKEPYESDKDIVNPEFNGMIASIDENVGHLLAFLKRTGLEEDTILIFMTDNGCGGGITVNPHGFLTKGYNAGMRGMKGSSYEGGHRVPCFIRWPKKKLQGGRDIPQLSAHIDILPTLIDLCHLKQPEGVAFDGVSIKPLLEGESDNWPDRVVVESFNGIVMTDRWRLVKERELYDIRQDPGQKKNVASKHPQVVAKLLAELKKNRAADDNKRRRFIIGSSKQTLTELTPEHWWGVVGWPKSYVMLGKAFNGPMLLEVEKEGVYEFSLRRWPQEVDRPIRSNIKNGKALDIVKARIKIGDFDKSVDVSGNMKSIAFKTHLKSGSIDVHTWFIRKTGDSSGAYFVYVRPLSKSNV